MQLLEQDKPAFKQWLLPQLASRSEAEPEVLADYVAELFSAEGSKAEIKRTSVEQLSDFLEDHTQTFVDEIATAIEQKIWVKDAGIEKKARGVGNDRTREATRPAQPLSTPSAGPKAATAAFSSTTKPPPTPTLAPDAPAFVPRNQAVAGASSGGSSAPLNNNALIPTGPRADRANGSHQSRGQSNNVQTGRQTPSRKRKLHERETSQSRNGGSAYVADSSAGEPPHKQLARRGGGSVGRKGPRANPTAGPAARTNLSSNATPFTPNSYSDQQLAQLPQFSPSDPMNPFNFLANMSAMMSMGYSGQLFGGQISNLPQSGRAAAKAKCPDYETKGICLLGTICPYDHGQGIVVPADPGYDPNNSSLAMQPHSNGYQTINGNSRTTSSSQRRERSRAPFSQSGPSRGSGDTVVVEQIPEDYFTEQHVRDFFSQFGAIIDVQMHAYKRLAVVKFSDHPTAQRAYNSPQVIFDNRFVKVYWYKAEHMPQTNGANEVAAQAPDHVGIPEIYNEDEDMIDMEEFKKQRAHLQEEFEEKRKRAEEATARSNLLNAQLRSKEDELTKLRSTLIEKARAKGVEAINRKEQRAPGDDLARLQSEAEGLFAHAGSQNPAHTTHGDLANGRGSFRGAFRGRGNARGGRGGVVRLDNRPRRLAIAGVEAGSEKERTLKQYLLNAKGCNSVHAHSEHADTLVVCFEERYQAEMFLDEASKIHKVSVGDLSWVSNDAPVTQQSIESDEAVVIKQEIDDDVSDEVEPKVEVDLDVADDNDQWL